MRPAFSTLFCRSECRAMLVENYIDPYVFITHLTAVPPTEGHETAGKTCFLLALLISSACFLMPQFLHPPPLPRFCCRPYLGLWRILLETAGLEPRLDIPENVETSLPGLATKPLPILGFLTYRGPGQGTTRAELSVLCQPLTHALPLSQ